MTALPGTHKLEIRTRTSDTGYPHDRRAGNAAYPYNGRADNAAYPHDRHI